MLSKTVNAGAVKVAQLRLTLQPHGLSMEFSLQEYWSGLPAIPFSRGSS